MIRAAGPEDLAELGALEEQLFGADAWDEPQLRVELTGPGRLVLVNDDGGLTAYAVTMVVGDSADLLRVGVRPDRQRGGAGTAMVATAMLEAGRAGARRMLLDVGADNAPARALYRAAGFEEIDRRRRYYRDGSDALVLARDL